MIDITRRHFKKNCNFENIAYLTNKGKRLLADIRELQSDEEGPDMPRKPLASRAIRCSASFGDTSGAAG
jgi:hypothetical protein